MLLSGDLGCRNELFAMGVIMFYMKAASLNRQTKLFRKIVENAQSAIRNFHCYP
jgi:membrane-anchored glycerophosphoryl diester phosphodiesterase (GDPDase)